MFGWMKKQDSPVVEKEDNPEENVSEIVFSPSTIQTESDKPQRKGKKRDDPIIVIPKLKSIRFRLWTIFTIMTFFTIAIMWVYELIYYSIISINIEESTIARIGNEIVEVMKEDRNIGSGAGFSDAFNDYIAEQTLKNRVTVVIFDEANNIRYSSVFGTGTIPRALTTEIKQAYYNEVSKKDTAYVFNTNQASFTEQLVIYGYWTVLGGQNHYVYVSTEISPIYSARNSFSSQMLVVSVVLFIIAVAVAYVGSGSAARPMRELTMRVGERTKGKKEDPLPTDTDLAEINELSAAFNDAIERAERNNKFRRELLANVSHDMKTPLTMIRAYAEMIRDITGGNQEKSAKNASIIISETDRMSTLISEVIELSKLESGVFEMHPAIFDLSSVIKETVGHFSIMEDAKGYNIETDIVDQAFVFADSERIERVLYNLIGNAMNYTGPDKLIRIKCRKTANVACVDIIDTGKGMTEEEMAEVWGKYYRLIQDKRKVLGSGLGLSIVKSILELHNVRYGVKSIKGKGSDFWFELPLVDPDKLD